MTLKNELVSMKTDIKQIVDRISVLQGVTTNITFMQTHEDWFYKQFKFNEIGMCSYDVLLYSR